MGVAQARRLVDAGRLGALASVRVQCPLSTLVPQVVELAQYLAGAPIVGVTAIEEPTGTLCLARFASGAAGSLEAAPRYPFWAELSGTDAALAFDVDDLRLSIVDHLQVRRVLDAVALSIANQSTWTPVEAIQRLVAS